MAALQFILCTQNQTYLNNNKTNKNKESNKGENKKDYIKPIGGSLRKWEKAKWGDLCDRIQNKEGDTYFFYTGGYRIVNIQHLQQQGIYTDKKIMNSLEGGYALEGPRNEDYSGISKVC